MSSKRVALPQHQWDSNKQIIVDLFAGKTLKEVRREMQERHGFDASIAQYEAQLKRWGVRKNRKKHEWEQILEDRGIPGAPSSGDHIPCPHVLRGMSQATVQRAKRWVKSSAGTNSQVESHIEPETFTEAYITEEPPQAALQFGEPTLGWEDNMTQNLGPYHHDQSERSLSCDTMALDTASSITSMFHSNQSAFGYSEGLDCVPMFSASYSIGQETEWLSRINFPASNETFRLSLGGNSTTHLATNFMTLEQIQQMPSTSLEISLNSLGVDIDRTNHLFAGFASRSVNYLLRSNEQSLIPGLRNTDFQRQLIRLRSFIPDEQLAIISENQASGANFTRMLLFSMLNGFAGLEYIPLKDILRFLRNVKVNRLLLEVLSTIDPYISKSLGSKLFQAAIESNDNRAAALLLKCKTADGCPVIDIDGPIHSSEEGRCTPIQQAARLQALSIVLTLVSSRADVCKTFYTSEIEIEKNTPLRSLIEGDYYYGSSRFSAVTPNSDFRAACEALIQAGAKVSPGMIITAIRRFTTAEVAYDLCRNVSPDEHSLFFREPRSDSSFLYELVRFGSDETATWVLDYLLNLCNRACRRCLTEWNLERPILLAAEKGYLEFVRSSVNRTSKKLLNRLFLGAVISDHEELIDFILEIGPDLDPPALSINPEEQKTTPLAEAVAIGNHRLITTLEESGGALNRLTSGGRFEPLLMTAIKVDDFSYTKSLITRATTSNDPYRPDYQTLTLAMENGSPEIVQLLLKAGICPNDDCIRIALKKGEISLARSFLDSVELQTAEGITRAAIYYGDMTFLSEVSSYFPECRFGGRGSLKKLCTKCIKDGNLQFFQNFHESFLWNDAGALIDCLKAATELAHRDMITLIMNLGCEVPGSIILEAAKSSKRDWLLPLLLEKGEQRFIPKKIGPVILSCVLGDDQRSAASFDALLKTGAVNLTALQTPDPHNDCGYYNDKFSVLGLAIEGYHPLCKPNITAATKLLEKGSNPNNVARIPYLDFRSYETALLTAIRTGNYDMVELLIRHGADVNMSARFSIRRTPIQYAAERGDIDMVRFLLKHNADVNGAASYRGGGTALQFAAISGSCNLVTELFRHGADLGALPSKIDGRWPLEGAAENGRLDMIAYLWELGSIAKSNGSTFQGFSDRQCLRAMSLAQRKGEIGCMELISKLSKIPVEKLKTEDYGVPWVSY